MALAADYHNTHYYQAPYRPCSRSNEGFIRDGNTEWLKMLHHDDASLRRRQLDPPAVKPAPVSTFNEPSTKQTAAPPIPVPVTSGSNSNNTSTVVAPAVKKSVTFHDMKTQSATTVKGSDAPYRPFEDKHRTDEYYRRYLQLSGNVAHRYPNPGFPRERQGAIGGSWRHVKEVLGHSGSQVCFVDGLVRLYDNEANRFNPQRSVMNQAAMATPAYALSRHNVLSYVKDIERRKEQAAYKPWEETSIRELPKASNDMSSSASRYKGYHTFRQ